MNPGMLDLMYSKGGVARERKKYKFLCGRACQDAIGAVNSEILLVDILQIHLGGRLRRTKKKFVHV